MWTTLLAKTMQFLTIFKILKNGRPILDYLNYKSYLQFRGVHHFPCSHWLQSSAWEIVKYLAMVEKEDLK